MTARERQNPPPLEDSASSFLNPQPPTQSKKRRQWSSCAARRRPRSPGTSGLGSLYLRRRFLMGIAFLLLFFVVVLEILNHFSNRDQGFVPAPKEMHHYYLWRYGPASVLTMVAAVWGQLEYRIQIYVPWTELSRGPLPANGNLLLNYVTPWSIKSLFRSLSAGHYAVALGIYGSIILKALVIVSTGLLTSETKQLGFDADLRMVDQFNLSLHAGSYFSTFLADPGVALWTITQRGVPYRPGATPEHAALSLSAINLDLEPDATFSANVPVFSVDQDCQAFSWTYPTGYGSREWFSLADIISKTDFDKLSPFCVWFPGISSSDPTPSLTNNVSSRHINATVLVDLDCPKDGSQSGRSPPPTDSAQVFTSIGLDLPGNVSIVSALLCRPKYSLTLRRVTTSRGNSTGGDVLDISSDILEHLNLGVSPSVLTDDILNSMLGYESLAGEGELGLPKWVDFMNMTTPQSDWKAFANPTLLSTAFQRTFRTLAVLTVKYIKTVPAAENQWVPGHITYKTARLVVTTASLRAMEALLGVSALVAMLLCLYNFKPLAERPPSLMNMAAVLAASNRLDETLSTDLVPRLPRLAANLRGYLFSSPPDLRAIHVQDDPHFDDRQTVQAKEPLLDPGHTPSKWWRPTAATKTFRISLIVTTLAIFIVLEVVYQVSNKHRGFVDAATEGYTPWLWLYLPPLSMAGLGLAYGSADIVARTLCSYSELSRGKECNWDVMQFDPRANTALVAVTHTLRRRLFGLSAIISTSLLSGLLTIAASGLYSTEPGQRMETVSLGLESWFDIQSAFQREHRYGFGRTNHDALVNQAVHFGNMSYPAGAYGEFAFAIPDTGSFGTYRASERPATLKARIPAAQTQANCSLYRFWDSMELQANQSHYGFGLTVPPPPGCKRGLTNALSDERYLDLGRGAGVTPPPGYFGFVSELWWKLLPNATRQDGTFTPDSRTPYTVCSDNTQHLFIIYGHRIDLTMHNVTLLHCLPFVQAIEVEAEFNLPALTIDENSLSSSPIPVLINEVPATPWNSPIKSHNSIPLPEIAAAAHDETGELDQFFTVLTRSARGATPMESLIGLDRADAMISRINAVYAQLGAQALNFLYRQPIANLSATATDGRPPPGTGRIEATVGVPTGPGRGRLMQNELSTRLLEGLLLCLAACGVVSFWVLRGTDKILPADPGTVAAQMGLLAGSELVERLRRDGGEGVEGERFGLGWWEREFEEVEGEQGEGGESGKEKRRWRYGIDIISSSSSESSIGDRGKPGIYA